MMEDRNQQLRLIEAILFATSAPIDEAALALRLPDAADVGGLLRELAEHYAHRGVHLVQVGEGWALRTAPDLASLLTVEREVPRRLSRAAMETLAVIAYHQPVTRAEIEEVRGVTSSKGTLDVLLEAGWIRAGASARDAGAAADLANGGGVHRPFRVIEPGRSAGIEGSESRRAARPAAGD